MADRPQRRLKPRLLIAVVAGLVPLVPIAVGLELGSGGHAPLAAAAPRSAFIPTATPHPSRSPLPAGQGAVVADLRRPTILRRRPGGAAFGPLAVRTPFGSPQAMLVVRTTPRWLGVLSPLAGNGRIGWIPTAAVVLSRVQWKLEVSLRRRTLTIADGEHVIERYNVAIGAPASPTPTGHFAVTDRLRTADAAGPYGCCILALTALAPHAIQGWSGGNRIAIHSTPETSSIGQAVSHGCVRLTLAQGRWLLAHIPLGTPTVISSA